MGWVSNCFIFSAWLDLLFYFVFYLAIIIINRAEPLRTLTVRSSLDLGHYLNCYN